MIAYKVVSVRKDNRRISCFTRRFNEVTSFVMNNLSRAVAQTEYHIGKVAAPKEGNGPLCCFESFLAANNFAHQLNTKFSNLYRDIPLEIWEAEVEAIRKYDLPMCWYRNKNEWWTREIFDLPGGTVLCTSVKLTRKLNTF